MDAPLPSILLDILLLMRLNLSPAVCLTPNFSDVLDLLMGNVSALVTTVILYSWLFVSLKIKFQVKGSKRRVHRLMPFIALMPPILLSLVLVLIIQ